MKSPKEIKEALELLPGVTIRKSFYRFVSIEHMSDLMGSVGSLRGGRYNLKKAFEVLYMAPDPETAIAETIKPHNFRFPPKMIITIDVKLQHVLDLGNKHTLEDLGINTDQLFCAWRIPTNKEAYTQTLGRLVYESYKFEGIRYPSVVEKGKSKYNLAVFPGRLKKGSNIKVYDPEKLVEQVLSGKK